jgi:hypothetical protein
MARKKCKVFYRVGHKDNQQGLWYTPEGVFTGSIHSEYKFCLNHALEMPYDKAIVGWISATPTLDELFQWFPIEDIRQLETFGFSILKYDAKDFKEYANHWVIKQDTSVMVQAISIEEMINND